MMSSARESAPKDQRENFLGALAELKRQAAAFYRKVIRKLLS